jgi:hypothetical protein
MLKLYGRGKNFIIRNSMFDIRYSFREHGKCIILELPTAEELAKHLQYGIMAFLKSLVLRGRLQDARYTVYLNEGFRITRTRLDLGVQRGKRISLAPYHIIGG